ncbi:MAG: hypothetical protein JSS53_00460 [Proteobacteria bacterium]|nr:hypothetical protein [Pseudomonadota bacterium]
METITKIKAPGLVLAVRLLWIGLILSFFTWIVGVSQNEVTPRVVIFSAIFGVITLSITAWIIIKISARRNWARILYLSLSVIGAPFSLLAMLANPHPFQVILLAIQFILVLTVLYLIFLGTGATEFEKFSLKSTKSKVLFLAFIVVTLIVWAGPFWNSGSKKDKWVAGVKLQMPAAICNTFVNNHTVSAALKEKNISYEKCVSLISSNLVDGCIQKYYSELPDKLSIVTGGTWGEKIGRCVGEEFYDKYLVDTNKK